MKRHIGHPRVEGTASRQAHCDLPPGTYEREMSKEGFFGPAAFFHHRHPPTGWSSFEGPLRPHAFDLTQLEAVSAHPWAAAEILHNAHCRIRFWRTPVANCSQGEGACVPYYRWVSDHIGVIGGR